MKRETRSVPASRKTLFRGATFSLAAILLVGLSLSPAGAARGGKAGIAPDLAEQVQNGSPSSETRLIVSLKGADLAYVARRVKELGGEVERHFRNVDQMVVNLPLESVGALAEVEGLDYISPDRQVTGNVSHLEKTTGADQTGDSYSWVDPVLTGLDGSGVTVVVLDSGIDADHFDVREEVKGKRRVVFSWDFTGRGSLDDPFGHGTHIAGIIAGDGSSALTIGRDYTGMAPGASLINFKVLDEKGHGYVSNVVAAIDQAISIRSYYNIRVINLSLAAPPIDSYDDDPLCKAVARATKVGMVVVAAAGNFGQDPGGNKVYGGIASPGISPAAITVGATNSAGTDARADDVIAPFSSRGPTMSHTTDPLTGAVVYDNLAKPDLVAPGCRLVSLERYNNYLVQNYPSLHVDTGNVSPKSRYMTLSGTSMSTGVVSGAVALMLQANPGLTPNLVKAMLMYSAQIMEGPDLFEQGAGMLNVEGAVRLAKSVSRYAYALPVGQTLAPSGLPTAQSTIAGETFTWSQGLIWGIGSLRGQAMFTTQQEAYAQSLIWGIGRFNAWGAGVTYYDGLYGSDYVVFGKNGQWCYVTWDPGTQQASGLIWSNRLYASGVSWQNQVISSDFFDVSSTSLIWGIRGYLGYDSGLIWGLRDAGLIWGIASER
ncbi:MAG: S8 family peptidase [Acidobacteriota bacterium]